MGGAASAHPPPRQFGTLRCSGGARPPAPPGAAAQAAQHMSAVGCGGGAAPLRAAEGALPQGLEKSGKTLEKKFQW